MRAINLLVVTMLVLSAAWVYKIKFEATVQIEKVSKMRAQIRRERDAVAILRAEWSQLDRPDRIQQLAQKHLKSKPIEIAQFDALDKLPERPKPIVPPGTADPIGAIIETFVDEEVVTGTVPTQGKR